MKDPSTPAATQRRHATRLRLFDAAIEVFAEVGVQGASVEAICQRADFTRGAFYSNFSTKEELFLALLDRELTQRVDDAERKARDIASLMRTRGTAVTHDESMELIATFMLPTGQATSWLILETEFLLMALRDPELAPKYHEFMTAYSERLGRMIDVVIRTSGRETDIPIDLLRSVLASQYEASLRLTALAGPDAKGGASSLVRQLADLLFALTSPAA